MLRRLPVSATTVVAVLCIALGATARADVQVRRPVAVIDLTLGSDPRVGELSRELFAVLSSHAELEPLAMVSLAYANALVGTPPDDDQQRIASAFANLKNAEDQLGKFNSQPAAASAQTGMSGLVEVTPSAAAPIFAQLAFAYGQGLLGAHQPVEAGWAFSLVHAITPGRTLDPNQYFPEVLDAFAAAKPSGTGAVDVRGTGEIWIDGTSYAAAPRAIPIAQGRHVVQLAGIDRLTRGVIVDVAAGTTAVADIADAPAPDEVRIRRARLALAHAGDTVERASTMGKLAKLVHVGDAILLSQRDGKLMVQTWRDRAPGFSAMVERGAQSPETLLIAIAPPPPPKPKDPPIIILPPEEPPWYRDHRVQVSVGLGVALVVAAAIVWARSGVDMKLPNPDITGL